MSLEYELISQDNTNGIEMNVQGDGTSTVLVLNLSMSPWDLNFDGGPPIDSSTDTRVPGLTATGAFATNGAGNVILTMTFSAPPPATSRIGPAVTFIYE